MAEEKEVRLENAKKQLEEERKLVEQSRAEFAERTKGKPTPTQEENDLANLGGFTAGDKHEEDGSNPDPHNKALNSPKDKQLEAGKSKPQTYTTKSPTT
jgi:hypothetical protein